MTNYTAVVNGVDGTRRSDEIKLMQASTVTPVVFDFIQADATPYIFEVGDIVTGTFADNETLEEFSISGTITPTIGGNAASWARSAADVGTPSEYRLYMRVTRGAAFDYTEPSPLTILSVAGVGVTPPSPLVGVSVADAAWLAAQVPALGAIDDGNMVNVQSGLLQDAGFAMSWNATFGTAEIPLLNSVVLQVGQESHLYGRNDEGSQLVNFDAVRTDGSIGQQVTIVKAQADTVANADNVGLITQATIAQNEQGYSTVFGRVTGDTSAWSEGDVLYLDKTTPGGLTPTKPTWPDLIIGVARVERSHPSEGVLLVRAYETAAGAHEKAAAAAAASVAKAGDTANDLIDNPAALVAAVSTATYDVNSLLYRHVELTLDHATPAITISGAVISGLTIWLIQGAAGTAVVDLSAFDFGDGDAPVVPLVAGEMVGFVASYTAAAWRGFDVGVIFA